MKRHLFGLVSTGLAVVLFAGCKSNPEKSLSGVADHIDVSTAFVTVDVADSQRVDAQIVDAQGTPLVQLPTVATNAPNVVSADTFSSKPVPQTSFWVKGLTFGTGQVIVSGDGLSDTIGVRTIPHAAEVGGNLPDTTMSGQTAVIYPIALDANLDSIAVPPDSFTFEVDNSAQLDLPTSVVDPATGTITVTAKLPGAATIKVTPVGGKGPGSRPTVVIPDTTVAVTMDANSGVNLQLLTITLPASTPAVGTGTAVIFSSYLSLAARTSATIVASSTHQLTVSVPASLATGKTYDVAVEGLGTSGYSVLAGRFAVTTPPAFTGTFNTTSPNTIDLVTATKGGSGPLFDADTRVFVGGIRAFIDNVATDGSTITFAVPYQLAAGSSVDVQFQQLGANQTARTAAGALTINATGTDPNAPADESTVTGPLITADGNYYVLLTDSDPMNDIGGGPANYFTVTAGASDLTLTVSMDWDAPGASTGDMDLYFCNSGCNTYPGDGFGADGFGAASSSKPEGETFTVPAGETWTIMLVRYAAGVAAGDLVQLHVTGF